MHAVRGRDSQHEILPRHPQTIRAVLMAVVVGILLVELLWQGWVTIRVVDSGVGGPLALWTPVLLALTFALDFVLLYVVWFGLRALASDAKF